MLVFFVGLFSFILISCSSTPDIKNPPLTERIEKEIPIPCGDESFDDDENYRDVGMSEGKDRSKVRNLAFEDAQGMLMRRLIGLVERVTTNWLEGASSKADNSGIERLIKDKIQTTISKVVNDAYKTCEKNTIDDLGIYHAYIALRVPKAILKKELNKQIQAEEELRIKFNEKEFQNFFDEQVKKYKEFSKEK